MKRIALQLQSFAVDESGATVIEYCLIASVISISILTAASQVGQSVLGMFQSANAGLQ